MSGRFDDKVVLITGAARGQGRSHAIRFAAEGAAVVGVDVCAAVPSVGYPPATEQDLATTVQRVSDAGGQMVGHVGDVRDLDQMTDIVAKTVADFGGIDVIVANAGIVTAGNLWELSPDAWREMIDVNLTGVWNTIRAGVPPMIERGTGGSIVFTSSVAGLRGLAGYGHYAASKHGVVGLARTLAIELGSHSIRVNTVHPTAVATPMVMSDPQQEAYRLAHPVFFDRPYHVLPVQALQPNDVSDAVLWLASDQAKFVTGTALNVDAGATQL
jgi:SDR family mycofactocin-dependent oxidoreductase